MTTDDAARSQPVVPVLVLLSAALIGRVAGGGLALALVVALAEPYGYERAGAMLGAYTLAAALATPIKGRLADRFQSLKYFVASGIFSLAALSVCLVAINSATWAPVALGALVVSALTSPPIDSSIRVSWSRIVGPDFLKRIHTVDSLLDELGFVLGPLATGALLVALSPARALSIIVGLAGLSLALFVTGAIATGFLAKAHEAHDLEPLPQLGALIGPFTNPRMWIIIGPMAAMGAVFGALSVFLPAYAAIIGSVALAGPLVASISVGGVIGGLLFGFREWRWPLTRQYAGLTLSFLLFSSWFLWADGVIALFVYTFLIGLWVTPLYICGYLLIDELIDIRQRHEANIWLGASTDIVNAATATLMGFFVAREAWGEGRLLVTVIALFGTLVTLNLLLRSARRTPNLKDST